MKQHFGTDFTDFLFAGEVAFRVELVGESDEFLFQRDGLHVAKGKREMFLLYHFDREPCARVTFAHEGVARQSFFPE